jgi:hypothetical protein
MMVRVGETVTDSRSVTRPLVMHISSATRTSRPSHLMRQEMRSGCSSHRSRSRPASRISSSIPGPVHTSFSSDAVMSSTAFIARALIPHAHRISSTSLDSNPYMRERGRRRSSSINRLRLISTRLCRRKTSPYSPYLSNPSVDASIPVMERHLAMHLTSKRRKRIE